MFFAVLVVEGRSGECASKQKSEQGLAEQREKAIPKLPPSEPSRRFRLIVPFSDFDG
jgi:hypothetical protein